MFKYAKTTKSCFTYENSKNKKLVLNSINKSKLENEKKANNKISVKNIQIKKDTTNSLVKPIRNSISQLKNKDKNNRKKINDYFNTLVKKTSIINNPSNIKNESNITISKDLQLEIPVSFKNSNIIYPPVNYNYIQKIDLKKQTKNKQIKLKENDDVKIELKKRVFSKMELKKYLVLIYDDIMYDEYENNQEVFDKTSNTTIKIKVNHSIKKKFHDNFISEINYCYNDFITPVCNRNSKALPFSDQDSDEDIFQLKKSKKETKEINKVLSDIYYLNINDAINNQTSPNLNEDINNKSSEVNISSKTINKPKKIIQQTIFSTFHSPVISTFKTRKRRFSNSNNVRKTNVKQTKLTFAKRQKTI